MQTRSNSDITLVPDLRLVPKPPRLALVHCPSCDHRSHAGTAAEAIEKLTKHVRVFHPEYLPQGAA